MNHRSLWYFEHFGLLHGLSEDLTPGDLFGELALTDDEPHDHRAEAADDTLLCEVPRGLPEVSGRIEVHREDV